jgi:hypothetical protein
LKTGGWGEYLELGKGVIGGWVKLRNEELHNFYSSTDIVMMLKSRRMIWARDTACMGR